MSAARLNSRALTVRGTLPRSVTQFQDLGAHHFDRRPPEAKARHLVAQLTKLGYTVQLQPLAEAA